MSIVASFYLIEKSKLSLLKANSHVEVKKGLFTRKIIDNYYSFLKANSVELPSLDYNGYNGSVFLNVLDYLQDKHEVKLIDKAFDEFSNEIGKNRSLDVYVLSYDFKEAMQDKLNPEFFAENDIQKFNNEIGDDDDLDTVIAFKKAIEVLYKNIAAIPNESYVLIFELGQ